MKDYHILPKLRDSLSYLYVDKAIINRDNFAIEIVTEEGTTAVPVANLCVLLLGPGTSITHAAMSILAEYGCSVLWVGEDTTRFYAAATGETRKAYRLLKQAELVSHRESRARVVLNMYRMRFDEGLDPTLTLPQVRGHEGVRVRKAYAEAARRSGVSWRGRKYDMSHWNASDPVNRALSAANALLNGMCHAAIVSGGYSPGLGFIHTGRQLSFVYDVADLYKVEITIPLAFEVVSRGTLDIEARVRQACRERFRDVKLLERILPDIDCALEIEGEPDLQEDGIGGDESIHVVLWEELYAAGEVGR
jgi:CRISPR-associated protein Cas1